MQIELTDQEASFVFVNMAMRLTDIAGDPRKVEARKAYVSILRKVSAGFGDSPEAQHIRDQLEAAEEMVHGRT